MRLYPSQPYDLWLSWELARAALCRGFRCGMLTWRYSLVLLIPVFMSSRGVGEVAGRKAFAGREGCTVLLSALPRGHRLVSEPPGKMLVELHGAFSGRKSDWKFGWLLRGRG